MGKVFYNTFFKKNQLNQFKLAKLFSQELRITLKAYYSSFIKTVQKVGH